MYKDSIQDTFFPDSYTPGGLHNDDARNPHPAIRFNTPEHTTLA